MSSAKQPFPFGLTWMIFGTFMTFVPSFFYSWFCLFILQVKCFWIFKNFVTSILYFFVTDISNHTSEKSKAYVRTFSLAVIFISFDIFKVVRVLNEKFGILVVSLTFLLKKLFAWFALYCIIWLPYCKILIIRSLFTLKIFRSNLAKAEKMYHFTQPLIKRLPNIYVSSGRATLPFKKEVHIIVNVKYIPM